MDEYGEVETEGDHIRTQQTGGHSAHVVDT